MQVPRLALNLLGMTRCLTFDACTFNSGGELAGSLEEGGAGARFFGEGAREMGNAGEDVKLGAGGSGFDAEDVGAGITGADPLARRRSFEDDNGAAFELGAEAEHGLRGKFAGVEASVEFGGDGHRRPWPFLRSGLPGQSGWADAQGVWLFQWMLWSL